MICCSWKAGHWSQGNPDASVLLPLYSFATGKDMNWSGMLEDLRYRLGKA